MRGDGGGGRGCVSAGAGARAGVPARGNSFFTGGLFRFAYDGIEDILDIIPGIGEEERESIDVGKYNAVAVL